MKIEDGKVVVTDSRGKASVTLPMVYIAFIAVIARFMAPLFGGPDMSGSEFGFALAAVGGIWLWREGQARNE